MATPSSKRKQYRTKIIIRGTIILLLSMMFASIVFFEKQHPQTTEIKIIIIDDAIRTSTTYKDHDYDVVHITQDHKVYYIHKTNCSNPIH